MKLHRFVIGIQFNRNMFRLSSLGGLAIDEVLKCCDTEKKLGQRFFTQISTPMTKDGQYNISFINDNKQNDLLILTDQIIFKKTATQKNQSVSVESVIEEFKLLWKSANKILNFPETRRIGLVGEYRIKEKKPGSAGVQLIDALTKFQSAGSSNRFHLTFENRSLAKHGGIADKDTDDFWNEIQTYYISNMDETPENESINANIDIQKYYVPAKIDPIKEIKTVQDRYISRKNAFKENMKNLGLSEV